MSRSGYIDDGWDSQEGQWAHIRWRGAVTSALKGKRGQEFLQELLQVLDEMPVKELHANLFVDDDPDASSCRVCAMGAVWKARGLPTDESMRYVDEDDWDGFERTEEFGKQLGIAPAMAREIAFINDDPYSLYTPRARYEAVRRWVISELKGDQPSSARQEQKP